MSELLSLPLSIACFTCAGLALLASSAPAPEAEALASPEAASIALPAPRSSGAMPLEQALAGRRSVRDFAPTPVTLEEVAQLLWAAQGANRPDGRRTAPSAGATYPLELRLVAGEVTGLPAGVYRYVSAGHRLERIAGGDPRGALAAAARGQDWVAAAPAAVVVSAVVARTAARYGERAERYVAIEVGHAAQNLFLQAVALGLGSTPVGAFSDRELARLAALPDGERPYLLLPVGRPR